MAFAAQSFDLVVDGYAGGAMRMFFYETADILTTVTADGYFARAARRGARPGDLVFVHQTSNGDSYFGHVASVDGSGNATLEVDQPADAALPRLPVFVWTGQSNPITAAAYGPIVPAGRVLKFRNGAISDANDPCGPVDGYGTAVPAFGMTLYQAGYGPNAHVCCNQGSSSAVHSTNPNGNWDVAFNDAHSLYPGAKARVDAALSAFIAAGWAPFVAGIIDCQGEGDGGRIHLDPGDPDYITVTQWGNAKQAFIARWRSDYANPTLPFYFLGIGSATSGQGLTGEADIRGKQIAIEGSDEHCHIIFHGANTFPKRSGMLEVDGHWARKGCYETGVQAARKVASGEFFRSWEPVGDFSTVSHGAIAYRDGNVGIIDPVNPLFPASFPRKALHIYGNPEASIYDLIIASPCRSGGAGIRFEPIDGHAFTLFAAGEDHGSARHLLLWDDLYGVLQRWDYGGSVEHFGRVSLPASTLDLCPLYIPPGGTPTALADGFIWMEAAGLKVRIGGVTRTVTVT